MDHSKWIGANKLLVDVVLILGAFEFEHWVDVSVSSGSTSEPAVAFSLFGINIPASSLVLSSCCLGVLLLHRSPPQVLLESEQAPQFICRFDELVLSFSATGPRLY